MVVGFTTTCAIIQFLSPLTLWALNPLMARCTRYQTDNSLWLHTTYIKTVLIILNIWFSFNLVNNILYPLNSGGAMVSVIAPSAIYRGFEPWSGQTKDCKIGIWCFSARHAALRRKNKDWLARSQDNVPELGDICPRNVVSVRQHYERRVGLAQSRPHHHFIENLLVLAMI